MPRYRFVVKCKGFMKAYVADSLTSIYKFIESFKALYPDTTFSISNNKPKEEKQCQELT